MTLTLFSLIFTAGLFAGSTAVDFNFQTTYKRDNTPCIEANVVCPTVDGPDSIYSALPDCTKFCQCSNGVPYLHECPANLHFNPKINVCDYPENAGCAGGSVNNTESPTTTTKKSTTSTEKSTTTTQEPKTSITNICIEAGISCPAVDGPNSVYAPLPDCTKFCQCSNGVPYVHSCPKPLHFNPTLNVCDWPSDAGCTGGTSQSTTQKSTTEPSTNLTTPQNTNTTTSNTTTKSPSTITTQSSETTTVNECVETGITCPAVDGPDSVYAPLPDCTKFCQCSNGVPYVHSCPTPLHFNPTLNVCDWPSDAGCTGGTSQPTTQKSTTEPSTNLTTPQNTNTTTSNTTTKSPSTITTQSSETTIVNECVETGITCPAVDGPDSVYAPLPDCTKFCQCSNGVPYVHSCPTPLHFNPTLNVCDWPSDAGCTGGTSQSTTQKSTTEPSTNLTTPQNTNTTTSNTTTKSPSTITTQSSETTIVNECVETGITCPAVDGPDSVYAPLPDCTKFCQCSNGVPYVHSCPTPLHFNPTLNVCDWPSDAGCTGGTSQSTTQKSTTEPSTNLTTPQNTNTTTSNTTTKSPSTITTQSSETTIVNECVETGITCPAVDGPDSVYAPLPDCTKFCQCSNGVPYVHSCPTPLHFNPTLNVCDWPSDAGCTGGTSQSTTQKSTTEPSTNLTTPQNTNTTTSNTTTKSPSTITTQSSETTIVNECVETGITCPAVDGPDSVYAPLPDCTKFCQCSNGVPYVHSCPTPLHFNPTLNVCDWPSDAGCTGGTSQSTTQKSTTEPSTNLTTSQNTNTTTSNTTTKSPSTITTQSSETTTVNECVETGITCPAVDGPDSVYAPLPDCTKFCQCSNGVPYVHSCPTPLHFNPTLNVCDWPSDAGCTGGTSQSTTQKSTTEPSTNLTTPQNTNTTTSNTTTKSPSTITTQSSETTTVNECVETGITCPAVDGPDSVYAPLPDCTKFCQCSNGVPYVHSCPTPLHFNPTLNVCDWPSDAGCTGGTSQSTTQKSTTEPSTNLTTSQNTNTTTSNTTTKSPSTITTQSSETTIVNECVETGITCPAVDGPDSVYAPLPDCTKFCQCSNGVPYVHSCPKPLHFNPTLNVCDWPSDAGCTGGTSQSTTQKSTTEPSTNLTTPQNTNTTTSNTTTKSPSTITTQSSETTIVNECVETGITCPAVDGPDSVYAPLPDCTKFCQCSNGVPYVHSCPKPLHFNPTLNVCDWPSDAGCTGGTSQSTTQKSTTEPSTNLTTPQNTNTTTSNTTTKSPSTITTQSSETTTVNECVETGITCPAVDGPDSVYAPLPDCTKFCQCSNGVPYVHSCPTPLHFNPTLNVCDWPSDAGCTGGTSQSTTQKSTTEPSTNLTTSQNTNTTTSNTTTKSPSTITTQSSETTIVNECVETGITCPAVDGPDSVYAPLPDCTKFCQCSNGVPYVHSCPKPLHFNPTLNVCDWPSDAGCTGGTSQSTTQKSTTEPSTNLTTPQNTNTTTSNTTTKSPSTITTQSSETTIVNECVETGITCPAVDGPDSVYAPLPDCTKFCQCSNGVPYVHSCPKPLHFNPTLNVCDWPSDAGCTGGTSQSTTQKSTTEPSTNLTTSQNTNTTTSNTTTKSPSTITTQSSETTIVNECVETGITCPAVDGPDSVYAPLPDCTKFCQCSNGVPYVHSCPTPLHFNPTLNVCDWPSDAGCTGGTSQSTTQKSTTEPSTNLTTPQNTNTTTSNTTTKSPSTITTQSSETTIVNECVETGITCPAVDGPDSVYAPLPDCTKFCQCSNGVPYVHSCPTPLHFNPTLNVCDWPSDAGCTGGTSQSTTQKSTTEPSTNLTTPQNTNTTTSNTTTKSPSTITTQSSETTIVNECVETGITCPAVDGPDSVYAPLPDCTKFCQCSNGVPYVHSCPTPLHFNPTLNVCDWPSDAGCTGGTSQSTTQKSTTEPSTNLTTPQNTNTTTSNTTTKSPSTITTQSSETTIVNECVETGITCPAVDGPDSVYAPLPDCTKFCQCSNGVPYVHSCPTPLHFNPTLNVCDWPSDAGCTGGTSQSTTQKSTTEPSTNLTTPQNTNTTTSNTTTKSPSTITTQSSETTIVNECVETGITCPAVDGPDSVYAPLPDCTKFCQCSNGVPYVHSCPTPLYFNPTLNVCDWPSDAGCTGGTSQSTTQKSTTEPSTNLTTPQNTNTTTSNTTTKSPSTITTQSSETTTVNECVETGITCPAVDGPDSVYAPLPDCTKFCQCSNGVPYVHSCPTPLYFNPTLNVCDWPSDAGCTGGTSQSTTQSTNASTLPSNISTQSPVTTTEYQKTTAGNEKSTTDFDQLTTENSESTNKESTTEESINVTTPEKPTTTTEEGPVEPTPCSTVIVTETVVTTTVISGTEYCLQNNINCSSNGPLYKALPDCSKFCKCSNGIPYMQSCPDQHYFNPDLKTCDNIRHSSCSDQNRTTIIENGVKVIDTECTRQDTTEKNNGTRVSELTTEKVTQSEVTTEKETTSTQPAFTEPSVEDQGIKLCQQTDIACPAVDSYDSVYGPGPNCTTFCQCSNGLPYLHHCPEPLHFNPIKNVCDWENDAGCALQPA